MDSRFRGNDNTEGMDSHPIETLERRLLRKNEY
jgi:hypothetical protein